MPDRSESKGIGTELDGPGVQLRRVREARGLLLRDVAQELHLDEWMLQALEEDDFSALGAPVFAKGHMRKYGEMLGLDPDDLMIAYYRKRGRDDSPLPITHMQSPRTTQREFSLPAMRLLIAALAVVLLVLLAWTFLSGDEPETGITTNIPPQAVVESTPLVTEEPVVDSAEAPDTGVSSDELSIDAVAGELADAIAATDGLTDLTTDSAVAEPDTGILPVVEEPAAPVASPIEVRLSFSGESWVEVTDSAGSRLLYDMMSAGRIRTVTGTPPIEVFLGRSRVVRLDVNGEFYPVPRRAIRGNTARFVIDGD